MASYLKTGACAPVFVFGAPGMVEPQLDRGGAGCACVKLVLDTPRGGAGTVEFHLGQQCCPGHPRSKWNSTFQGISHSQDPRCCRRLSPGMVEHQLDR